LRALVVRIGCGRDRSTHAVDSAALLHGTTRLARATARGVAADTVDTRIALAVRVHVACAAVRKLRETRPVAAVEPRCAVARIHAVRQTSGRTAYERRARRRSLIDAAAIAIACIRCRRDSSGTRPGRTDRALPVVAATIRAAQPIVVAARDTIIAALCERISSDRYRATCAVRETGRNRNARLALAGARRVTTHAIDALATRALVAACARLALRENWNARAVRDIAVASRRTRRIVGAVRRAHGPDTIIGCAVLGALICARAIAVACVWLRLHAERA